MTKDTKIIRIASAVQCSKWPMSKGGTSREYLSGLPDTQNLHAFSGSGAEGNQKLTHYNYLALTRHCGEIASLQGSE